MKKIILFLIILSIPVSVYGQSAFDIRWGDQRTYQDAPGNTLKQWAERIEGGGGSSNLGTGKIFYVDSNVSTEGDGTSWRNARNTLDEAIDLCTASRGDIIFIAQGHTEIMGAAADEVDANIDGITIIGCGTGSLMPKFNYTGDVTGAFAVGADNITIVNCRFRAAAADANDAIEIEAGSTDLALIGCVFDALTEGTHEFHECINQSGAVADGLKIIGCEFRMGAGAARSAIAFLDADYALIRDNVFSGDYAVADVNNATTASNHILIKDNIVFNGTIGGAGGLNTLPCIAMLATTTGVIADNYVACNVAADDNAIVGADMFLFGNVYTETEGPSVGIVTAAGS